MTIENHTIRLLTEIQKDLKEAKAERREMRTVLISGLDHAATEREKLAVGLNGLNKRITESQTRLSTELLAVAGAVQEAKGLIMQQSSMRAMVEDHEIRLRTLESNS